MKSKCKVCKEENCYAHCQAAVDGKHEAHPESASQADGCNFLIDYNCKHCHQSGAVRVDPKDIQWE